MLRNIILVQYNFLNKAKNINDREVWLNTSEYLTKMMKFGEDEWSFMSLLYAEIVTDSKDWKNKMSSSIY